MPFSGANPVHIAGLVATRGLALTASGIIVGFVLYAMTAPFLGAFLYEVKPTDPMTLAAVTLLLVGTAGLASWLPARRAARVDPAQALRGEQGVHVTRKLRWPSAASSSSLADVAHDWPPETRAATPA